MAGASRATSGVVGKKRAQAAEVSVF